MPQHNLRGAPSFVSQIEKNQEILSSMRDVAPFGCGVLTEIPPNLLSLERVLDTLDATQEVLRRTRLHSRGTPRVSPQLKKSPVFLPPLEMRVYFPASLEKESQCSRHTSRRGDLNLKLERNSRGRDTIPKYPNIPIHSR